MGAWPGLQGREGELETWGWNRESSKSSQGEDEEGQISKIRALGVLSLWHVVEFYPICSLGICLSIFFFPNICSYTYQILERKEKELEVTWIQCA